MKDEILGYINESIDTKKKLLDYTDDLEKIINVVIDAYKNNHKLLVAGNGGSAADSQHFVAEMIARYKMERRSLPAIALTTDSSNLTSIGNDYDFNQIFKRQIESLGNKGDVFFAISTSGNSSNLITAIEQAKKNGVIVVSLLGKTGGKMKEMSDYSIVVPSNNTPRIQECHILMIHTICEIVEKRLFENGNE